MAKPKKRSKLLPIIIGVLVVLCLCGVISTALNPNRTTATPTPAAVQLAAAATSAPTEAPTVAATEAPAAAEEPTTAPTDTPVVLPTEPVAIAATNAAPAETPDPRNPGYVWNWGEGTQKGTACVCGGPDLDCADFTSWKASQACFDKCGGSATNNMFGLDNNHNGVVCEKPK